MSVIGILGLSNISGTKFLCGECHMAEDSAGIILFSRDTFLVGNTVLCCTYKILSTPYYPYNRKNTKRNGKISAITIRKITVYHRGYSIGNIVTATAATTAMLTGLLDLCIQYYGIDHLDHH